MKNTVIDNLIFTDQYMQLLSGIDTKRQIRMLDSVQDEQTFVLTSGDRVLFSMRGRKKTENSYHTYLFHKAKEEELL